MTRSRLNDQTGVILLQVGVALAVLLGFCAFAIDYGVLMTARAQAQNAADAGAIAAATTLAFDFMEDAPAVEAGRAIAASTLVWGETPGVVVQVCNFPDDERCPRMPGVPPVPEPRTTFGATVSVYRDGSNGGAALPTYFARLFGVNAQGIRAQASATATPANVATCVWPLAIPDDWRDQQPADPALPVLSICTGAADQRCDPFTMYLHPGAPATVAPPDVHVEPSPDDSEDTNPTGYQLSQSDPVMKSNGLEPQIFVEEAFAGPDAANPPAWRPIRRSSFVPVQIGGGGFSGNLTACNPSQLHIHDSLTIDTSATWTQATEGALDLVARDSRAEWDGDSPTRSGTFRIRGSCAAQGTCGLISPRLVLLPVFDPEEYDRTRGGGPECSGLPCVRIVNFVGFFIDSDSDSTQIVGHLTTYPGSAIDIAQPFVGYRWAFLRKAVLTR